MYKIIEKTKIWFSISLIIILIGVFTMATKGLEYGLDFKGGTVVEIKIGKDFQKTDIDNMTKKYASDIQSTKVNNTSSLIPLFLSYRFESKTIYSSV